MYFKIILIALIVFACLIIAYPETRLGLKELIKKHPFLSGSLLCLVLVIITFLYFPPLFRLVAIDFWEIPVTVYKDGTVEVVELADLGSIGDIFGSLNSFISSIALCAVAVSTWLQVTSLREARDANKQQLELAEKSHQEQLKESRNAVFVNQFYSLLNYKREKFNNIVMECKFPVKSNGDKVINALTVMQILITDFITKLDKNSKYFESMPVEDIREEFFKISDSLFNEPISPLISYFFIYKNLISLIQESLLEAKDKANYLDIMCNSMFQEEQMILFRFHQYFRI